MSSPKRRHTREPLESQESKRPRINDRHGGDTRDARDAALKEAAGMQDWLSKEDDFVLKQAKKRAAIRVRESRAKPIDFLAVNLRFVDAERDPAEENELEEVEVRPKDPSKYILALHPQELDELYDDLNEFYKLELNRSNKDYWRALLTVCKEQRKQKRGASREESKSVNPVIEEIDKILQGKTTEQLKALEVSIRAKLDGREPIDVDYWEQLYKSVRLKQAWTRLESMYLLIKEAADRESDRKQIVFRNGKRELADAPTRYKLDDVKDTPSGTADVVRSTEKDFESAAARLYKQEANHELEEDEELFNKEADVPKIPPKWTKKFPEIMPIKPKYFNRVQLGFEWNSYNKIHYSEEDLPPKVVWGYRFNIFYPHLLDSTKAPTYKIERQSNKRGSTSVEEEMCIIKFSAGAPYDDVSFQIVDKDWDHSSRYDRGFKSSFDKGILQLHFKFKRISYRK